eukprot:gnl/TRDRNA2_/TRDRNA2_174929_c0_seq8.p1 gnl/TRDRNA2_/TRDRNA2_174929_c0~~gnl/TRDRNA2_/TRDRNA2_174929_c0_seq8.p1  ORF type:complete len:686 (+),score=115.78 gnl/TRDRNA2_/TRDRNA2_174929_c0_seq8:111-2168(+)
MWMPGRFVVAPRFILAAATLVTVGSDAGRVPSQPVREPSSLMERAARLRASQPQASEKKNFANLRRAALLELKSETVAEAYASNGPLYIVAVDFDWKTIDAKEGVSIIASMEKDRQLVVVAGQRPRDAVAWGHMTDNLDSSGWIELYIQQTEDTRCSNDVKMYASGFIEGLLTAARISQFYSNFYQLMGRDEINFAALQNIRTMLHGELEYIKRNANFHAGAISVPPPDPYWAHIRYVFEQMWGVKDGYNFAAEGHFGGGAPKLDLVDMMLINSHAEVPDLIEAYKPSAVALRRKIQAGNDGRGVYGSFLQTHYSDHNASGSNDWTQHLSDHDWELRLAKRGRCSALVRLASENKDLFVGHTTWSDYSKMTRIFKYYEFQLPGAYTFAKIIGMSSYPGCVSSTDNFYIMDSGLTVMDTSLEILNPKLFDLIPEFPNNPHIPTFMHVMSCNRMARTAPQWTTLFAEQNGGTNNAQWMVVDFNRFDRGHPLPDNAFWLLEQVPGLTQMQDLSHELRSHGYWASYNRPYFKETRQRSGHAYAQKLYGELYSYAASPRAGIFSRLSVAVETLFDMRGMMNRNSWPNEGVVPNEPGHAISARLDLDKKFGHIPNGGIDAKVVNRCLIRSLQCQAISGPSHDSQPVFKWKDDQGETFSGWPHLGMPDVWNFNWQQMTPSTVLPKMIDQCAN